MQDNQSEISPSMLGNVYQNFHLVYVMQIQTSCRNLAPDLRRDIEYLTVQRQYSFTVRQDNWVAIDLGTSMHQMRQGRGSFLSLIQESTL